MRKTYETRVQSDVLSRARFPGGSSGLQPHSERFAGRSSPPKKTKASGGDYAHLTPEVDWEVCSLYPTPRWQRAGLTRPEISACGEAPARQEARRRRATGPTYSAPEWSPPG